MEETTFEVIVNVGSELSLTKTREDNRVHRFTKVNHLIVDGLLRGIVLH